MEGTTAAEDDRNRRFSDYEVAYRDDTGFEKQTTLARCRASLEFLARIRPSVVVEVGCGLGFLYGRAISNSGIAPSLQRWVIIEPSEFFIQAVERTCIKSPQLRIVQGFVEDKTAEVLANCPSSPDVVICSSLLHEVPNLGDVLKALSSLTNPGRWLRVDVPNADSFHRRLAIAMGLIQQPKTFTERNVAFEHHRIFDMVDLRVVLEDSGFDTSDHGGFLLKPFTHLQMEQIPFLDQAMLDGLFRLGQELPELAASIYVNARKL